MNPCQICGAPATRTVTDHEYLPDETFVQVDSTAPPWHLCAKHAGRIEDYRNRLIGSLAHIEGLLASTNAMVEGFRASESITMAGDLRQLLLDMKAEVEAKLQRIG